MNEKYKWDSPMVWFLDMDRNWQAIDLINFIAETCDNDQIQDYFQSDMERDGYFEPLKSNK